MKHSDHVVKMLKAPAKDFIPRRLIKSMGQDTSLADWLKSDLASKTEKDFWSETGITTDSVGRLFLELDKPHLCWWRIGNNQKTHVFLTAMRDMGKDFILDMPIPVLPIGARDAEIIARQTGHKSLTTCSIREMIEAPYLLNGPAKRKSLIIGYGSKVEISLKMLQEAGFTKKDGAVFKLDLKASKEIEELRSRHTGLGQAQAKFFLAIARREGWIK